MSPQAFTTCLGTSASAGSDHDAIGRNRAQEGAAATAACP